MKRLIISIGYIFFLFSCGVITAQTGVDTTDKDQIIISEDGQLNSQIDVQPQSELKKAKIKPGLEAGTSFSYSPGNFYGPSFYLAPNVTYFINPRFAVQAGVGVERSNLYSLYKRNENGNEILPMTRAFFYTKGSYLLTSRITVDGTVYHSINDVPKLTKYGSPINYSQNGAIIGINYKLNSSLSFGFHVQMYNDSFHSQPANFYNPAFGY